MVNDELKQIPQGSTYQNMLRADYHNIRRHELIRNPELPAKNSLMSAIQTVRQESLISYQCMIKVSSGHKLSIEFGNVLSIGRISNVGG